MKKNIFFFLQLLLIFTIFLSLLACQSGDADSLDEITPDSKTITISIRCDEILQHYDQLDPALRSEEYVPADGIILAPTEMVLREGDTVFDLLYRITRYHRIPIEYQGGTATAANPVYIQGINSLYEFSCGETSGWIYCVNDTFSNFSCSLYRPTPGDTIEWIFSCTPDSIPS